MKFNHSCILAFSIIDTTYSNPIRNYLYRFKLNTYSLSSPGVICSFKFYDLLRQDSNLYNIIFGNSYRIQEIDITMSICDLP